MHSIIYAVANTRFMLSPFVIVRFGSSQKFVGIKNKTPRLFKLFIKKKKISIEGALFYCLIPIHLYLDEY